MIGTTLSHFKITAKLGEGGMGEVYRAEDTKLDREVAIKVLPEAVASDPERLARFEREAKVLASLNHSNIAAIYSLESEDGVDFLVMELAEGEDLAARITRGPVAIDEAMPVALQIAEALETAHERSIVHRDLKPANVMVTPTAEVKVLDFGLAKALEFESDSVTPGELSLSPTLTAQMTGAGVILGTAAYMSPEQARGQMVDRRTDIWAFGCVLFEMLAGSSPYSGETVTDILGAIVHKDPDWSDLPEDTPPAIRELLERCVEKDPRRRLQAIGEARLLLQRYLEDPASFDAAAAAAAEPQVPETPLWRRILPWTVSGLLAMALGLVLLRPTPEPPLLHATIPSPDGQAFHLDPYSPGPAVLAPDGSRIAFSARDGEGNVLLYLRRLDAGQAVALPGTQDAQYPFWSPDSQWIGFFNKKDRTLKKIKVDGSPPITLSKAEDGKGGSWNAAGVIVFAPGSQTTLHRVSAAGGESTPVFAAVEEHFNSYRHPRFLPDGRHLLFVARRNRDETDLMLGSLDGEMQPQTLKNGSTQGELANGHLFFMQERTLLVQPFDDSKLEVTGEAVPIAGSVVEISGSAISAYSVSQNGRLLYQTGTSDGTDGLEWVDRAGEQTGVLGDPAIYRTAMISPDGRYAMAALETAELGTYDLWLNEIERDVSTRFTFSDGDERMAAWLPDSEAVIYSEQEGETTRLYRQDLGGVREAMMLLEIEAPAWPTSVSPDGRHLAYQVGDIAGNGNLDLWILPLDGSGGEQVFRQTEFNEAYAQFSPDGRWVTYLSDESGRLESYVEAFPGPGRRWRISTDSGVYPYWRNDGSEIFYHELQGQFMAVDVEQSNGNLRLGPPRALFMSTQPAWGGAFVVPAPQGEQFLIVPSDDQSADSLLRLVVNWPAALENR